MMTDTTLDHLARLREDGAHHYDPVRFRYLESLALRLHDSPRPPSAALQEKLGHGLMDYQTRFVQAREEARALMTSLTASDRDDSSLAHLQSLLDAGDLKQFQRRARPYRQPGSSLIALIDALQASDTDEIETDATPLDALLREQSTLFQRHTTKKGRHSRPLLRPQRELKALRHLRATRARLHTQKRIDHAIDQTPGDAGPLNAHRLVTRSVETLRELSPEYLNRFVGYMDTLLALEKVAKKG